MNSSLIPSVLRRNRNARRQTLSVVGGLAGLSPQHLSEIESGSVDARLSTIERIARVLGLAVMLVPLDKASELRRYIATNGRAFRTLRSGETEYD